MQTLPQPITEAGIYDLTNEAYHADPAVSSTQLVEACRSLAHFWEYSPRNPNRSESTKSKALEFGTAMHMALLEPAKFEAEYLVAPAKEDFPGLLDTTEDLLAYCRQTGLNDKGNKQKLIFNIRAFTSSHPPIWDLIQKDFEAKAEGRKVVSAKEKQAIVRMADRLKVEDLRIPDGRRFRLSDLFKVGKAEESIFWQDKDSGLMCRIRTDWRIDLPGFKLILDYKTTMDARQSAFGFSAQSLYYWMRAAMYIDGVEAVTGERYDFAFLAQEKDPPYLAGRYFYADHNIDLGRELYKAKLKQVAECLRAGKWPGYSDELREILVTEHVVGRHPELEALAYGEV